MVPQHNPILRLAANPRGCLISPGRVSLSVTQSGLVLRQRVDEGVLEAILGLLLQKPGWSWLSLASRHAY